MKYQPLPKAPSRREAESILAGNEIERICEVLLALAEAEPDRAWVEETCLAFLSHADPRVRSIAATSMGHLARLGHKLNLDRVLPGLATLLANPSTAGFAQTALDDIHMFH